LWWQVLAGALVEVWVSDAQLLKQCAFAITAATATKTKTRFQPVHSVSKIADESERTQDAGLSTVEQR
jgi:hypothetical protein